MKKETRRMKRMARHRGSVAKMNLTSLMDVFTILVFFLLTNTSSNEALDPPKVISLPASVVESKPREAVTLMVTDTQVLIDSREVMTTDMLMASESVIVPEIKQAMINQLGKSLQISAALTQSGGDDEVETPEAPEVNILADRSIPFQLLKKVMSSCTDAGYPRVSLAVLQKGSQE